MQHDLNLSSAAKAAIYNTLQDADHVVKTKAIIQADLAPRVLRGIELPFGKR
jgi:hypothetical protein